MSDKNNPTFDSLIFAQGTDPDELSKAFFNDCRNNPNNLSAWYPKIRDCGFRTPGTQIIFLSDEEIRSLFAETPQLVRARQEFIEERLLPVVNSFPGPVFLKSGCVSDKFSSPSCLPADKSLESISSSLSSITGIDLLHDICGLSESAVKNSSTNSVPSPKT